MSGDTVRPVNDTLVQPVSFRAAGRDYQVENFRLYADSALLNPETREIGEVLHKLLDNVQDRTLAQLDQKYLDACDTILELRDSIKRAKVQLEKLPQDNPAGPTRLVRLTEVIEELKSTEEEHATG